VRTIVHLTSSRFHGGPERQMLGLARALPTDHRSLFVSFAEGGSCRAFLDQVHAHGIRGVALMHDTPHILAARTELAGLLNDVGANVLCCHGYKANVVGRLAARRAGIPAVAVSRGWTADCLRVRCYEALDRLNLRWMDHVVCVSQAQAVKVRRVGVPAARITVIPNAIDSARFAAVDAEGRRQLQGLFPTPRERIVLAAGRLSPEKGFAILIEAAARVLGQTPSLGFALLGDGPLREPLTRQIAAAGIGDRFVLAGFRPDLDRLLPGSDLLVLPSYTEGLPNVVLEAFAARVPVVATAVGGTPEVIEEGVSGFLIPPGDVPSLAARIREVLATEERRRAMGERGYLRVTRDFTFATQSDRYQQLFANLLPPLRREGADGEALALCPSSR
jgi:glycosyltransferase involved in cell wall biosynthesis